MNAIFVKGERGYVYYDGKKPYFPDRSIIADITGPCLVRGMVSLDKGNYGFIKGDVIETRPFNFSKFEAMIKYKEKATKNFDLLFDDYNINTMDLIKFSETGLELLVVKFDSGFTTKDICVFYTDTLGDIKEAMFLENCNLKFADNVFLQPTEYQYVYRTRYGRLIREIISLDTFNQLEEINMDDQNIMNSILVRMCVHNIFDDEIKAYTILNKDGKTIGIIPINGSMDIFIYKSADGIKHATVNQTQKLDWFKNFFYETSLYELGSCFQADRKEIFQYMKENFIVNWRMRYIEPEAVDIVKVDVFGEHYEFSCWDAEFFDASCLNDSNENYKKVQASHEYLKSLRKHYGKYLNSSNMDEFKKLTYENILNLRDWDGRIQIMY